MVAKKPSQLAPTRKVSTSKLSKSVKQTPTHARTLSLPVKCASPTPDADDILASLSMSSLSMSKTKLVKSRNRALTATDFASILCEL